MSAVGSAEITDGQLSNADISGTAAIATSKLSGSVTSIAGNGLGAFATLSAVSTAYMALKKYFKGIDTAGAVQVRILSRIVFGIS